MFQWLLKLFRLVLIDVFIDFQPFSRARGPFSSFKGTDPSLHLPFEVFQVILEAAVVLVARAEDNLEK